MDKYLQAISSIIQEQELIVGKTVALWQAKKVASINVQDSGHITLNGDPKEALSSLVQQYSELFGQASVEVCKEAIRKSTEPLSPEDLPDILK